MPPPSGDPVPPRAAGFVRLDPADLTRHERYKLLIGGVAPRPIGVICTADAQGRHNVAPYSFFMGVGSDPMMLLFCPANDENGGEKDSLRNARPTSEGGLGEFVACVATEGIIARVNAAAEPLPHGESEFDLAGLTPAPSDAVRPPRVAESPIAYECVTDRVIRTNPGVPGGGNIVLGRVVRVHVREDVLDAERLRIDQGLGFVGRMGGAAYAFTRDTAEMPRGRDALSE